MKRFLLVLLLVSSLLLSVSMFAAAQQTDFKGKFIIISSDQPGGGWYPFGGALVTLWQKYIPGLNVTLQGSTGENDNLIKVEQKRADIGFANVSVAYDKSKGLGFFEGKPAYEDLRALFACGLTTFHIVTPENSPIKTPFDFKGKKYGFYPIGTAPNVVSRNIFEAYGLKEEDMKSFYGSEHDIVDGIKDKLIDVGLFATTTGSADMLDLVVSNNAEFVTVTGTNRDELLAKYPYYSACIIPKEAYGTSEDIDTIGVRWIMVVDASMDEDLAYALIKTFYEKLDEFKVMVPATKSYSIETAFTSGVPMHPGSEKYLKEMGIIK